MMTNELKKPHEKKGFQPRVVVDEDLFNLAKTHILTILSDPDAKREDTIKVALKIFDKYIDLKKGTEITDKLEVCIKYFDEALYNDKLENSKEVQDIRDDLYKDVLFRR